MDNKEEDLEIIKIPGIQQMIKLNYIKEKEINPDHPPVDHQFNPVMLLSSSQEDTEEEELSS